MCAGVYKKCHGYRGLSVWCVGVCKSSEWNKAMKGRRAEWVMGLVG